MRSGLGKLPVELPVFCLDGMGLSRRLVFPVWWSGLPVGSESMPTTGVHVRINRLLASLVLTAIALTGCDAGTDSPASTTTSPALAPNGVEKLSAAGIVAKARQAAVHASAVRVKSDVTDDGQRIKFDMRLLADRGGTGTLTVRGGSLRITRIGHPGVHEGQRRLLDGGRGRRRGAAVRRQMADSVDVGAADGFAGLFY
jgi:hypothetical protein